MLRKILLPSILLMLSYGFWVSPSFKEISAGVAIFLFGMLAMEQGFKALTGGFLEHLLTRTTNRLWKSLSFGIVTTTLMQSSSLVSVIAISFLGAGMITLASGIGIIFGANLGTTTGAWLVAGFGLKVSISAYAMPILVFGVLLVFQRSKSLKGIGYVLLGLGFLFLGIHYMKEGYEAFKAHVDLSAYAVTGIKGLFLYVFIGIAATVIMQSSHATLVLTITALASGQIAYENALALAIGSNIGTTITAILGAISSNIEGRRLAAAHLIFNLVTAVIAMCFIGQLVWAVDVVAEHLGIAPNDYALQLAVFHSLFNVIGIVVMLPAIPQLVSFLEKHMRAGPRGISQPEFLNESAIDLPDLALEVVRRESIHLYANASAIIADGISMRRDDILGHGALPALVSNNRSVVPIDIDSRYEQSVKPLFAAIIEFISLAQRQADDGAADDLATLAVVCRHMVDSVKGTKHLHKNLSRYMNSTDTQVRGEYDRIRLQVVHQLRLIGDLDSVSGDPATVLSFDDAKMELMQVYDELNRELTTHIRDRRLSPVMATSIMNDSRYAYEIGMHLVTAAQLLSSLGNPAARAAATEVALDARDLRAMSEETPGNLKRYYNVGMTLLMPKSKHAGSRWIPCMKCSAR